ncbi:MAG: TetR family transcriptional regulator [Glaciihabitans sp.]|nr:TetR family transcriptional regulator [Glaciihabitans sp.]
MPRAGVTPARILDEAEVLVDVVGLEGLTLSAIADKLGIRIPSLYKHIEGLPRLQRDIAVSAKRELAVVLHGAADGKSGPDAITGMAHALRSWALAHPGRYAATVRAPQPGDTDDEAASAAATEVVFAALAAFDLGGSDAVDATRGLRSVLHGFVALELADGFGMPEAVDRSFDRLVEAFVAALPLYR